MTTVFLDYDGTLHESIHVYAPAFRLAYGQLERAGLVDARTFSDAEIARWLGYPAQDMWATFQPQLSAAQREAASRTVREEMARLVRDGKARLYPGALAALEKLRAQGARLVFLSNCSRPYMDAHRQAFALDCYFDAFYCIADYPVASKVELYRIAARQYPGAHIMAGDRFHDFEVARAFGLPFIGCRYGYGAPDELTGADILIDDVAALPEAAARLSAK